MATKTQWDRPSHFICADRCSFGMTTVVGGVIVSTVGDYRPDGGRERIGADRFYETMVFHDSGKRCKESGCPCGGMPEPSSWTEIDFDGYQTADEARRGHEAMVAKYADLAQPAKKTTAKRKKKGGSQ